MSKKIRCGNCWQVGHNRLKCPKIIAEAESGDKWAKAQLERNSIKRCSYCSGTDHNRASCDKLFTDTKKTDGGLWAACLACISVIKEKKIAPGALIYGPLLYRREYYYRNEDSGRQQTYELTNFIITDIDVSPFSMSTSNPRIVKIDTLSEPQASDKVFSKSSYLPFFIHKMYNDTKIESHNYLQGDGYYFVSEQKQLDSLACPFEILQEADDEQVEKLVSKIYERKPIIVDFDNRKEYQSYMRKLKKESK